MIYFLIGCLVVESAAIAYLLWRPRKPNNRPDKGLAEFLADIQRHGYGVIRVSPDDLMLRSPRSR